MPHTINVEHDGVQYAIYVASDDVTCLDCHRTGHVARNCHTTVPVRTGSITFADLAAGRQVTKTIAPSDKPVSITTDTRNKQTTSETMMAFPVLVHPRQRLSSTSSVSTASHTTSRGHQVTENEPVPKHLRKTLTTQNNSEKNKVSARLQTSERRNALKATTSQPPRPLWRNKPKHRHNSLTQ
jgi:hypothetical protein